MSHLNTTRSSRCAGPVCSVVVLLFGIFIFGGGASTEALAATMTIVNVDGGGEGLNDPTVVPAVGGNLGVTRGAQRLNALEFAKDLWAARLTSSQEIFIEAGFDPFACDGSGTFLTFAGANILAHSFGNAPVDNVWYPIALTNKLNGTDSCPPAGSCFSSNDMTVIFNSVIDDGSCVLDTSWYYGLDALPPANQVDFVSYALGAIARGLGFDSFMDPVTGESFDDRQDIFTIQLIDLGQAELWTNLLGSLDAGARAAGAKRTGSLHYVGPLSGSRVLENAGALSSGLGPWGTVDMHAPDPPDGDSVRSFSTAVAPAQLNQPASLPNGVANHDFGLSDDVLADIGWQICGNGVVEMDELCDDGNPNFCDGCGACQPTVGNVCGDGTLRTDCGGERCDDGNNEDGDGCDATCGMEKDGQSCQKAIAKAGAKYHKDRVKRLAACRNKINQGKLVSAPEDCVTDPAIAPKLAAAGEKLRSSVDSKCTDELVAALNSCASSVDGLINASGDGGCLFDAVAASADAEIGVGYGRVLLPAEAELDKCQRVIQKEANKYLRGLLKFDQKCRDKLNAGKEAACNPAADAKLNKANSKLRAQLVKGNCANVGVVADLEACYGHGFNVSTLARLNDDLGCLERTSRAIVDQMIEAIYGQ